MQRASLGVFVRTNAAPGLTGQQGVGNVATASLWLSECRVRVMSSVPCIQPQSPADQLAVRLGGTRRSWLRWCQRRLDTSLH